MALFRSSSKPAPRRSLKQLKLKLPVGDGIRKRKQLLELPSEIRLMIYEQMFPPAEVQVNAIRGSLHRNKVNHLIAGSHVAALAACRMVYTEAKPILYANTTFRISIQDQYWLLLWDATQYEVNFDPESFLAEPDPELWNKLNPWLHDPRSIVPVNNIRRLSLDIECHTSEEAYLWTWTGQLKHTLREARYIRDLRIMLKKPTNNLLEEEEELQVDQQDTNLALQYIGHAIKCGGTVTGEMDMSLGAQRFDSSSYYEMLAALKGVDKTNETFSNSLAKLRSNHAEHLESLKCLTTRLKSRTDDRIKFTGKQSTWIDYAKVIAVPRSLNDDIRSTLNCMMAEQEQLQHIEEQIALLQSNAESLKVSDMTIAS